MRKIVYLSILCMCMLCGCKSNSSVGSWKEADFAFYDYDGREILFPTTEDYWIHMDNKENIQTYREVRVGDRAKIALDKYDLTDFEYEIADFSKINPSTDESNEVEKYYKDKGYKINDMIIELDVLSAKDLDLFLYCDIYKQKGKLCTSSDLVIDKEYEDELTKTGIEDEDNRRFKSRHLKYSISFSISDGKIIDVSIESNYHNWLNATTTEIPDWLKELGN